MTQKKEEIDGPPGNQTPGLRDTGQRYVCSFMAQVKALHHEQDVWKQNEECTIMRMHSWIQNKQTNKKKQSNFGFVTTSSGICQYANDSSDGDPLGGSQPFSLVVAP